MKAADHAGNTASVAAASAPGACHHRLSLSPDALARLDQGGRVPLSQSWVHGDVIPNLDGGYRRYDTVSLDFMQYDTVGVQGITGLWSAPISGCQLNLNSVAVGAFINVKPLDSVTPVVVGPGGVSITMEGTFGHYSTTPSDTTYPLDAIPPSSFVPGDWSVQAPGGNDIAAGGPADAGGL